MAPGALRGLMLVTDQDLCLGRPLAEVVRQAVLGGVSSVQFRGKQLSTRAFLEQAAALKALLAPLGVPLIINDRVDVALALGVDGVHVGQEDLPATTARRLLGPAAIIGLSVETWEEVERAQDLEVDYLGVSPVFATATKTDTKAPWGLAGLARIKGFSRHPLVGIGGISLANCREVALAGADSLAVVSAICSAADPEQAARALCLKMGGRA